MDTAHWPQGIGIGVVNKSMEDSSSARPVLERKARPQKDQALNCPRCNSTTTKFCYYNNYSLTQPRYFCKTCRRYWTEGGSLRNVPVGGGSRKNNKRSNSSSPSTSSAKKLHRDHNQGQISNFPGSDQNPKIHYQGQDLNLAYPPSEQDYENIHIDHNKSHGHQNPNSSPSHHLHHFSAMELLKNGMVASRGLTSFLPMSVVPDHSSNNLTMFSAGFPMQEFKPSHGLSFSLDGFESGGFGCLQVQGVQESLKQQIIPSSTITTTSAAATTEFDQNNRGGGEGDNISGGGGGYWNGMLGGGSW